MAQQVFNRKEIKYLLTEDEYQRLFQAIAPFIEKDRYFKGTNCSVYYDTPDKYLVTHSMEKPLYKEKLRIRSYNVPTLDDTVYLEIKRKFKGVGNKRRIGLKLADFYRYLETGHLQTDNPQIKQEIDYCFQYYQLQPALYLAYDRHSYNDKATKTLRITFDANIRSRTTDLRLEHGDRGQLYFQQPHIVMETKTLGAYPLWFSRALSEQKIYPASFSKYGKVYQRVLADQPVDHAATHILHQTNHLRSTTNV